jgi:hypothetical protein
MDKMLGISVKEMILQGCNLDDLKVIPSLLVLIRCLGFFSSTPEDISKRLNYTFMT